MREKYGILIGRSEITRKVGELAAEIRKWAGESAAPICAVWLAEGAMFFAADLLRGLSGCGLEIFSLKVSSYGDSLSPEGRPKILTPLPDVAGMRALIIDDVLDTGATVAEVSRALLERGAKEVKICVLLDKRVSGEKHASADFVGFKTEGRFAFGYGMDLRGKMRELPDIMALQKSE